MAMTSCDERGENTAERLVEFVRACPSMFHTAATVRKRLEEAGFAYLPEASAWSQEPGGSYYTIRNNSSVVAWKVGERLDADSGGYHFQMAAAHGDSPTFKVKSVAELAGPGECLRLDVEPYGGMIDASWLDRPLGVAGRVMVREGARVESRLLSVARPVAIIPSVAIHLTRERGAQPLDRAADLYPLFSAGALGEGSFDAMVADELGVAPEQVLSRDLFLVNLQEPVVWGAAKEFVSAPRLDDLQCVHAALEAFLGTHNTQDVSVFACFDNEEVGSGTKQGAKSTLLADVLSRVSAGLGRTPEEHLRALAGSFLVSCDNAHAVHPNRPDLADPANRCRLNGGIVVKEAANQHYCTDAFSRAVFCAILDDAGVPWQTYANRSDMAGGGTLGNLSNLQVSVHAVDVGLPQLAMHSAFETAGAQDTALGIDALTAFYSTDVRIDGADAATLG